MKAIAPKLPTTADVSRGRAVVQQELTEARKAHDEAAYEAASKPGDEIARDKLAAARRRLGVLQSELEGLDAVGRVAKRREQLADVQQQILALDQQQEKACADADAVIPAFDRVVNAIEELKESIHALNLAEAASNRSEKESVVVTGTSMLHFRDASVQCRPYVEALLWLAIGQEQYDLQRSDMAMDVGGRPTPDVPLALVRKRVERAKSEIELGIAKQRERLTGEASSLGAKAA